MTPTYVPSRDVLHEVNTLLTRVVGFAGVIVKRTSVEDPLGIRAVAENIEEAGMAAARMLSGLPCVELPEKTPAALPAIDTDTEGEFR